MSITNAAFVDGSSTLIAAGPESAPPVILLHGWGACKAIWKHVLRPPLTDRFRLVAIDLPGTGSVPIRPGSLGPDIADWIADEATSKGIERFAVLGHSMGGNIAMHLAERHPERIAAMVLVAPAIYSNRLAKAQIYLHDVFGRPVLAVARALAGVAGLIERGMPPNDTPGWARGYVRRSGFLKTDNSLTGLLCQLRGLLESPATLERVSSELPVLIVHGRKDSTIPLAWSEEALRSRLHGTRLLVYHEALHCPMDTDTVRFCSDVTAFLDEHLAPSSYAGSGVAVAPPA